MSRRKLLVKSPRPERLRLSAIARQGPGCPQPHRRTIETSCQTPQSNLATKAHYSAGSFMQQPKAGSLFGNRPDITVGRLLFRLGRKLERGGSVERLLDVVENIVDMLEPDRQPHIERRLPMGICGPVESAAVHDQPAYRCSMPAEILRRRIHHDGGTMIERPGRNRGIVDDLERGVSFSRRSANAVDVGC